MRGTLKGGPRNKGFSEQNVTEQKVFGRKRRRTKRLRNKMSRNKTSLEQNVAEQKKLRNKTSSEQIVAVQNVFCIKTSEQNVGRSKMSLDLAWRTVLMFVGQRLLKSCQFTFPTHTTLTSIHFTRVHSTTKRQHLRCMLNFPTGSNPSRCSIRFVHGILRFPPQVEINFVSTKLAQSFRRTKIIAFGKPRN